MGWQFALAAGAQLAGGIMGKKAADKQAKNAKMIGALNSALIELETETNIRRTRQQARKLIGAQKSAYAKGGVIATSGSAYELAMETQILAEQDVMLIAHEGKIRKGIASLGGQSEAQGYGYAGTAALIQGVGGAVNTYAQGS